MLMILGPRLQDVQVANRAPTDSLTPVGPGLALAERRQVATQEGCKVRLL